MNALLALFFLTVASIAVARYYEDDNLFWKFAISLYGAVAAGYIVTHVIEPNEQDNVVMIEKAPTQVLESMPCSLYTLADISLAATKWEKSPKPVSKDTLLSQNDNILSDVFGHARGQPHFCMYYDDS